MKNPMDVEKIPRKELWKPAPSLKPSMAMIEAAAHGQPEACAIRDAWQFKHHVRILPRDQYEALVEKGMVTFHG